MWRFVLEELSARYTVVLFDDVGSGNSELAAFSVERFENLLQNAVKYNENDPEMTITCAGEVASDRVVIAVADNGIGMSADCLERAFEPFVRLGTGSRYRGGGLGLSIVRKMAANHGGEVRVESEPGVGSTFYVTLPTDASAVDDGRGAGRHGTTGDPGDRLG